MSTRVIYTIVALGLATFAMGQTILFAVLGPLIREIGLREIHVGYIVSGAALVIAMIAPIWGGISDRIGRRLVITFGLMSYSLTMLLFVSAIYAGLERLLPAGTVLILMISIRLLYAVLTAGIQPAATAYVADITSPENRTSGLAIISGAYGLGTIIGPVFGAALAGFGVLVPLLAAAILAFIAGLLTWQLLPKSSRTPKERAFFERRLFSARLAPHLFMMFGVLTVGAAMQQTAAFYIQDLFGLTPVDTMQNVGIIMGASALVMIAMQVGIVQIFRPEPVVLIRAGLVIAAIGLLILLWADTFISLLLGYITIGASMGLLNPGLMAGASLSMPRQSQGGVAGLMGSAMSMGFFAGPLIGTWLYGISAGLLFQVLLAIIAVVFVASFMIRYRRPKRASNS